MNLRMTFVLLLVTALLSAFHTTPPKVDCEKHLSAINAPARVAHPEDPHP